MASAYGTPPLELTTGGGIFTTRTLEWDDEDSRTLCSLNAGVLKAFGLMNGVSHTEFICGKANHEYYFLETSARVGGAHIADLIESATGVNLWVEWAKIEAASARGADYRLSTPAREHAGLLVSLTRQERPDTSSFIEPELVWRLDKPNHLGFIVKSSRRDRVEQLLSSYVERVRNEFQASAPPQDTVSE